MAHSPCRIPFHLQTVLTVVHWTLSVSQCIVVAKWNYAARVEPRPQYLTLSTCTCRKPWPRCVMCVDGVVSSVFLLRSILTFDCRWGSCVSSYIVKTYIICLVVRLGRSGYKFSFAEIHSTWSNLGFGSPRLQRLRLWRLFDGCIVTSVCIQVSVHAINFPGCVRLPLATVCYPLYAIQCSNPTQSTP